MLVMAELRFLGIRRLNMPKAASALEQQLYQSIKCCRLRKYRASVRIRAPSFAKPRQDSRFHRVRPESRLAKCSFQLGSLRPWQQRIAPIAEKDKHASTTGPNCCSPKRLVSKDHINSRLKTADLSVWYEGLHGAA